MKKLSKQIPLVDRCTLCELKLDVGPEAYTSLDYKLAHTVFVGFWVKGSEELRALNQHYFLDLASQSSYL